jgi:hypothetical protein
MMKHRIQTCTFLFICLLLLLLPALMESSYMTLSQPLQILSLVLLQQMNHTGPSQKARSFSQRSKEGQETHKHEGESPGFML